jgi:hypothetical protein
MNLPPPLPFFHDPIAGFALAGLLVATVIAILSAVEKEKHRSVFVILAMIGFVIGGAAVWKQHEQTAKSRQDSSLAAQRLEVIRATTANTNVTVDDLAKLNALSRGRFHIGLTVDDDESIPCQTAHNLNAKYSLSPGRDVRVVRRRSRKASPFCLLFGADLPISAAEIYQRFANANAMSNGPAVIELERPDDDEPRDCSKVPPPVRKRGA